MAIANAIPIAILACLSAFGYYTTLYLISKNGTGELIEAAIKASKFPGTDEPLRTHYLGIAFLDKLLLKLVTFFYQLVDGSHPAALLQVYHFMGQTTAGWGLLTIESLRRGNRLRAVSFLTIWGLALQVFTYAVVGPIFLLTYLLTSPTVHQPNSRDLELETEDILSIFPAMLIGFVLPTFLMLLPAPSYISYDTKQIHVYIWQFFPLLTWFVRLGSLPIIKLLQTKRSGTVKPLIQLRVLYASLFTVAVLNHLSTMQVVWTDRYIPMLLAKQYKNVFTWSNVWWPTSFTPEYRPRTVGAGGHQLLKYDEIVLQSSLMIWAIPIFFGAINASWMRKHLWAAFAFTLSAYALPPVGFAVALIWIRDEMMYFASQKKKA